MGARISCISYTPNQKFFQEEKLINMYKFQAIFKIVIKANDVFYSSNFMICDIVLTN